VLLRDADGWLGPRGLGGDTAKMAGSMLRNADTPPLWGNGGTRHRSPRFAGQSDGRLRRHTGGVGCVQSPTVHLPLLLAHPTETTPAKSGRPLHRRRTLSHSSLLPLVWRVGEAAARPCSWARGGWQAAHGRGRRGNATARPGGMRQHHGGGRHGAAASTHQNSGRGRWATRQRGSDVRVSCLDAGTEALISEATDLGTVHLGPLVGGPPPHLSTGGDSTHPRCKRC